jgi:uncharacterized protein
MTSEAAPQRLDVRAMALHGKPLTGREQLSNYTRLVADLREPATHQKLGAQAMLNWEAHFETRTGAAGGTEPWLQLNLATQFPLVCQRCMAPLDLPVSIHRAFRFVATEAIAIEQDDDSEEDLLVLAREFDLAGLIEDELVMALPLIPRHDVCPTALPMSAVDADFDESAANKPKPFAALSSLLKGKT